MKNNARGFETHFPSDYCCRLSDI